MGLGDVVVGSAWQLSIIILIADGDRSLSVGGVMARVKLPTSLWKPPRKGQRKHRPQKAIYSASCAAQFQFLTELCKDFQREKNESKRGAGLDAVASCPKSVGLAGLMWRNGKVSRVGWRCARLAEKFRLFERFFRRNLHSNQHDLDNWARNLNKNSIT